MLTAPKVISALLFAALGWYVSQLIIPHFEARWEGKNVGALAEYNAVFCAIVGWRIAGSRVGDGWNAAISYGLTTAVAMTFTSLFFQSFGEMIRKALDRDYGDSPMDAIVDVFQLMIKFSEVIIKPDVLTVLLGGGIFLGLVIEWCGRRWR